MDYIQAYCFAVGLLFFFSCGLILVDFVALLAILLTQILRESENLNDW